MELEGSEQQTRKGAGGGAGERKKEDLEVQGWGPPVQARGHASEV